MAGRTPYPQEMKERAVRMVGEIRDNYANEYAAIKAVAARLGIGSTETMPKWLRRAQVDAGLLACPDRARNQLPRAGQTRGRHARRKLQHFSCPGPNQL
jgi:transposase-like protein